MTVRELLIGINYVCPFSQRVVPDGSSRTQRDAQIFEKWIKGTYNEPAHKEQDWIKHYRTCCQQLPLWLRRFGLASTLSWLWHKDAEKRAGNVGEPVNPEHWTAAGLAWALLPVLVMTGKLTVKEGEHLEIGNGNLVDSVLRLVQTVDLGTYLALSHRALEAGAWLKRYAESLAPTISDSSNSDREEEDQ